MLGFLRTSASRILRLHWGVQIPLWILYLLFLPLSLVGWLAYVILLQPMGRAGAGAARQLGAGVQKLLSFLFWPAAIIVGVFTLAMFVDPAEIGLLVGGSLEAILTLAFMVLGLLIMGRFAFARRR